MFTLYYTLPQLAHVNEVQSPSWASHSEISVSPDCTALLLSNFCLCTFLNRHAIVVVLVEKSKGMFLDGQAALAAIVSVTSQLVRATAAWGLQALYTDIPVYTASYKVCTLKKRVDNCMWSVTHTGDICLYKLGELEGSSLPFSSQLIAHCSLSFDDFLMVFICTALFRRRSFQLPIDVYRYIHVHWLGGRLEAC